MTHVGIAATAPFYGLGEGVVWDDRARRLRWVDIDAGRILSGRLEGDTIVDIEAIVVSQTTGAVALADDGGLLIAAARGLATISTDGVFSIGPDLLDGRLDARLNDGCVDPQGRFVVGTLALGADTGAEKLHRVSTDGEVETIRSGIRLSNGIAFSPDGSTIYHVDSLTNSMSSHSYGPGGFDGNEPWVVVIDDLPDVPDGMTVSSDGTLWIAIYGGFGVNSYSPSGELLERVRIDAPQATCPAFVGPRLDMLAITSAQKGLGTRLDQSGAVFLSHVGSTGLPEHRWLGSTSRPYWKEQHA